ncbi:MAG: LysM peptidoglycan-binding domain-containing protein [Caldilinea sp.]|nr:LysM peptidoglycan-binding domain-containing protein [Caldilinea sp.]MDW8440848.1 LysM peptidoglycan-binding domain-containing protein [Caldilineaceae bacterium]
MHARHLLLGLLLLTFVLLAACTRERPTPTPTATGVMEAQGGAEPVVEVLDAQAASTLTPARETSTPTPEPTATRAIFQYTVQAGDTLSAIARRFNISPQQVRELNNLVDDNIFAGQVLRIPEGEPTPTPEPFRHIVQPGETLFGIAMQYGVNVNVLAEVNAILDRDNLPVGKALLIPGVAPSPAAEGGAASTAESSSATTSDQEIVTHVVQPNETLNSIALDYGVSASEIAAANAIANPNLLRVGQRLVIPGVTPRQVMERRGVWHTVQPGESLSGIAQSYGVSIETIMAANDLRDPNTIVVGQRLLIPR